MIQHLSVRNFQSLHHVEIDLAPFTVVVGPSSSGKSALTRAVRTLTGNARGSAFITQGEHQCVITATTERGTVTLTRTRGPKGNAYTVIPDGDPEQQSTWTKLDGDTPAEVSQFLGIPSGTPINYAGQLDMPFLLGETGGSVARTLGALTNVSVIFDAARESNRQKLAETATLRTKNDDLAVIKEQAKSYRGLKEQIAQLDAAETHLDEARRISRQIARLTEAVSALEIAEARIPELEQVAELEIPSDADILEAAQRLEKFRDTLRAIQSAKVAQNGAQSRVEACDAEIEDAEHEMADALAGLAEGIRTHWQQRSTTRRSGTIQIEEGSTLAADYIVEILT